MASIVRTYAELAVNANLPEGTLVDPVSGEVAQDMADEYKTIVEAQKAAMMCPAGQFMRGITLEGKPVCNDEAREPASEEEPKMEGIFSQNELKLPPGFSAGSDWEKQKHIEPLWCRHRSSVLSCGLAVRTNFKMIPRSKDFQTPKGGHARLVYSKAPGAPQEYTENLSNRYCQYIDGAWYRYSGLSRDSKSLVWGKACDGGVEYRVLPKKVELATAVFQTARMARDEVTIKVSDFPEELKIDGKLPTMAEFRAQLAECQDLEDGERNPKTACGVYRAMLDYANCRMDEMRYKGHGASVEVSCGDYIPVRAANQAQEFSLSGGKKYVPQSSVTHLPRTARSCLMNGNWYQCLAGGCGVVPYVKASSAGLRKAWVTFGFRWARKYQEAQVGFFPSGQACTSVSALGDMSDLEAASEGDETVFEE